MPVNFISEQKMEKLAKRVSKVISRNINTQRYTEEFDIESGSLQMSGTTNDFNIKVTESETMKLKIKVCELPGVCQTEQVGKLKFDIVYKCTVKGLPSALKSAWKNVDFEGQSFQQNSTEQDYIYNSINTLGTEGSVDWGNVDFSQSIVCNFLIVCGCGRLAATA